MCVCVCVCVRVCVCAKCVYSYSKFISCCRPVWMVVSQLFVLTTTWEGCNAGHICVRSSAPSHVTVLLTRTAVVNTL